MRPTYTILLFYGILRNSFLNKILSTYFEKFPWKKRIWILYFKLYIKYKYRVLLLNNNASENPMLWKTYQVNPFPVDYNSTLVEVARKNSDSFLDKAELPAQQTGVTIIKLDNSNTTEIRPFILNLSRETFCNLVSIN